MASFATAQLWARDGPTPQESEMHQATTLTVVGISALALATVLSVYAIIHSSHNKRKLARAKAEAIAELKQRFRDGGEATGGRRMYQAPRLGDPHGKVTPSLKQGSFNVDMPMEEAPRLSSDLLQLRTPRSSQDVFARDGERGRPSAEMTASKLPAPVTAAPERQELKVLSAMVRSASSLSEGLVNLVVRRPEKAQLKGILLPSPQPSQLEEGRFTSRPTHLAPPSALLRPPTTPPPRSRLPAASSSKGLGKLPPTPSRTSSLSGHDGGVPLTPVLDLDIELAATGRGGRRLNTADGRDFEREKDRWLLGVRAAFDGPVSPAPTDIIPELPAGTSRSHSNSPSPYPHTARLEIPGSSRQLQDRPSPTSSSSAHHADFRPLTLGFTPSSSSRSLLNLTLGHSDSEPKLNDGASSWRTSALRGVFDVSRSASIDEATNARGERGQPRSTAMSSSGSGSSAGTSKSSAFETALGSHAMGQTHSQPSTAKTSVDETSHFAIVQGKSFAPPRIMVPDESASGIAMSPSAPFSSPFHRSVIPDQVKRETHSAGGRPSLHPLQQAPTSPLLAQLQAEGSALLNASSPRASFASTLKARLTRSKSSTRSIVPAEGPTTPKLEQLPSSSVDGSPFGAPATEQWAVSTTDSGIFSSRTARKQPAFLSAAALHRVPPPPIGLGLEEDKDAAVLSETEELIRSGLPSPVGTFGIIDRKPRQPQHRRDESSVYEASPIMQDAQWHNEGAATTTTTTTAAAYGSPALLQDMASPASFQEAESISFSAIEGSLSPRMGTLGPEEAAKVGTSPLGRFETLGSAANSRRQSLVPQPTASSSGQGTPRMRSFAQAVEAKTSTAMSSPALRASVSSSEATADAVAESIAETISLFSHDTHAPEPEQRGMVGPSTDEALSQRAELLRNVQKEVALAHAQRIKHAKRMEQERIRQEELRREREKLDKDQPEATEMLASHASWTQQHVQGAFVASGSTSGVLTQVLSNALLQRRPAAPASGDLAVAVSTECKQTGGFEGPLTPPLTPARPVVELQAEGDMAASMPTRPANVYDARSHRSDSPLRSISTAIDLDSPPSSASKMRPLNLVSSASAGVRASSSRPFVAGRATPSHSGSAGSLTGSRMSGSGSMSSSGSWAQLSAWGTAASHQTHNSSSPPSAGAKRASRLMGGGVLPAISHESSPSFVIGSLPTRPPSSQSQVRLSQMLANLQDSPTRHRASATVIPKSMAPVAPSASYRAAMQHHHEMATLAAAQPHSATRLSSSSSICNSVGMAM